MEINLPKDQVEQINKELKARNVAHFKCDDKDFYIRIDDVSFEEKDSVVNHTIRYQEARAAVSNDIKTKWKEHYVFTSIAYSLFKEVFATGKMVSVYCFSNSKYDTVFPEDLIARDKADFSVLINES